LGDFASARAATAMARWRSLTVRSRAGSSPSGTARAARGVLRGLKDQTVRLRVRMARRRVSRATHATPRRARASGRLRRRAPERADAAPSASAPGVSSEPVFSRASGPPRHGGASGAPARTRVRCGRAVRHAAAALPVPERCRSSIHPPDACHITDPRHLVARIRAGRRDGPDRAPLAAGPQRAGARVVPTRRIRAGGATARARVACRLGTT
jgi:hypothetical protein